MNARFLLHQGSHALFGTLVTLALHSFPSHPVQAEEISLRSLGSLEDDAKEEDPYGPFVGVYAGSSGGESTDMMLDLDIYRLNYDVTTSGNNLLMGFEVGYAWQTRYFLEFALSFEGMFSTSELDATFRNGVDNDGNEVAPVADDIARARVDMSYVAFLLNGQVTLDLQRLRPRMGNFITRFRPYVGGGLGGAQLWFREPDFTTFGNLAGNPDSSPNVDVFDIDEFVFAYQFSAGLEVRITDNLDAYVEYRELVLESPGDLNDLETNVVIGGFQYRY